MRTPDARTRAWRLINLNSALLKRIKTYLRSTMSEQHLVDPAVLSVERDLSGKLAMDTIVDHFAAKDRNRRIMLT